MNAPAPVQLTPAEDLRVQQLQEQAARDAHQTRILVMVLTAAAAGIAVGWLIRKLLFPMSAAGVRGTAGGGGGNVTNIWVNGAAQPAISAGGSLALPDGLGSLSKPVEAPVPVVSSLPHNDAGSTVNHRTILQSMVLDGPTKLCQAPSDRSYVVHIRAVAPPGSFVMIADNAARLTGVVGDGTFVIPAGESHDIRLRPNQQLYARGNVAKTIVSYALSPELL